MTLSDLIELHAQRTPDAPALAAGLQQVGYKDWHQRVEAAAGMLMAHHVQPGDTVAIGLPNAPYWQWAFLLGALRLGAAPAVLGARPLAELRALGDGNPHVVALAGSGLARVSGIRPIAVTPLELSTLKSTRLVRGLPALEAAEASLGLVLFSLIGTSTRALRLDAGALRARIATLRELYVLETGSRLLSALTERVSSGDARGALRLVQRVSSALMSRAYRSEAGDWESDEEGALGECVVPTAPREGTARPYFEVLFVSPAPHTRWPSQVSNSPRCATMRGSLGLSANARS